MSTQQLSVGGGRCSYCTSRLNFLFFGYSDILPETVAAKIVTLSEIVLAFVTVIVMLSDFISLKESLRGRRSDHPHNN